jgi:phosphoglucomutase
MHTLTHIPSAPHLSPTFRKEYGRSYYCRYDYEGVQPAAKAEALMAALVAKTVEMTAAAEPVQLGGVYAICTADEFSYTDPVDKSVSEHQVGSITLSFVMPFVMPIVCCLCYV